MQQTKPGLRARAGGQTQSRSAPLCAVVQAAACVLLYMLARNLLLRLPILHGYAAERTRQTLEWAVLLAATVLAALPALLWAWGALGKMLPQGKRGFAGALGLTRPHGGRHQRRKEYGRLACGYALVLLVELALEALPVARLLGGSAAAGVTLPQGRAALALAFLQLCVASPVVEELLFRGAVQRLLRPCGAQYAVLGQAVLFAALHGTAAQIVYAGLMGLLLGQSARRSGSLRPGIALHALNNGILFAALLAGGR
jgi:membrane protease YdiL (CAAX protease family)